MIQLNSTGRRTLKACESETDELYDWKFPLIMPRAMTETNSGSTPTIHLFLRKLRKTLFKRKLHELLLKVLETEKVYVDINAVTRINLMSLLS